MVPVDDTAVKDDLTVRSLPVLVLPAEKVFDADTFNGNIPLPVESPDAVPLKENILLGKLTNCKGVLVTATLEPAAPAEGADITVEVVNNPPTDRFELVN